METNTLFFDVRKHSPKPGQILAKYRAVAVLDDGIDKEFIIDFLLNNRMGAEMAVKALRNRCGAIEGDALKVAINMATDLCNGMSKEEVTKKEYTMNIECMFYCNKEDVPDNPHWTVIKLLKKEDIPESTSFDHS